VATIYEFPTGNIVPQEHGETAGILSPSEVIHTYPVFRHQGRGLLFACILMVEIPDGRYYGISVKEFNMVGTSVGDLFDSVFRGFFISPDGDLVATDFIISSIIRQYMHQQTYVVLHPGELLRLDPPGPGWEKLDIHRKKWVSYESIPG
jgi:hypothetical protein